MKLIGIFNNNYVKFVDSVLNCFPDEEVLKTNLKWANELVDEDPTTRELFDAFSKKMHGHKDEIFNKDMACVEYMFPDSGMSDRMDAEEVDVFCEGLITLLKCSTMISACGTSLSELEEEAMGFVDKHKGSSTEEIQMSLLKEVLSGNSLSQKLQSVFQNPESVKNIMENIPTILRTSGDKNEMSSLSDMLAGMLPPGSRDAPVTAAAASVVAEEEEEESKKEEETGDGNTTAEVKQATQDN